MGSLHFLPSSILSLQRRLHCLSRLGVLLPCYTGALTEWICFYKSHKLVLAVVLTAMRSGNAIPISCAVVLYLGVNCAAV